MNLKRTPSDYLQGLREHWRADVISGFLVFLLALPLSLGIAKASGFPAIAGIYTAVIGGLVVSLFSGSKLSIKGPAAGLIAIAYGAVTELGGQNLEQGYRLALACIVVSGIVQVILGLIRAGSLADFFPASVVHGMLAAIGIIIISKQVHVMFGVKSAALMPLDSFLQIGGTVINMNPYIAFIGMVSLLILFVKPMVKHPLLNLVPGQLLVLIFAIPAGLALQLNEYHEYNFHGKIFTVDPEKFLVMLPHSFFPTEFLPDFSKVFTPESLKYIVLFALVGSVESLLTAKAVDALDPYKRKANMNRDLLAVGIGNTLSGLLGGLPMISEVARSSNNIANGAMTRWANFFHGLFLLVFVLLAVSLIELIPNAALAAMLIYTGYKLAAPDEFKNAYRLGPEQFVFFSATVAVTILTNDLLDGVGFGILLKLIYNMLNGARLETLFRIKVDMFHEGNYYRLKMKSAATFSNFLGLKRMISKIPRTADVTIDMSESPVVDHTTLEGIHAIEEDFIHAGGRMHIIGFENHHFASMHPLALRKKINNPYIGLKEGALDTRQTALQGFAELLGFEFDPKRVTGLLKFTFGQFPLIKTAKYAENEIVGEVGGARFLFADISRPTKSADAMYSKTYERVSVVFLLDIPGAGSIPEFSLSKEDFSDIIRGLQGSVDIDFENHPEFSNYYFLEAENEEATRGFFSKELIQLFEAQKGFFVESRDNILMISKGMNLMNEDDIRKTLKFISAFIKIVGSR